MSDVSIVNLHPLKAMLKFSNSPNNLYRPFLNGVYLQSHPVSGCTMVVTDIHRFALWHEADAVLGAESIFLPYSMDMLAALKGGKHHDENDFAVIDADDNKIFTFQGGDAFEKKTRDEGLNWIDAACAVVEHNKVRSSFEYGSRPNYPPLAWQDLMPSRLVQLSKTFMFDAKVLSSFSAFSSGLGMILSGVINDTGLVDQTMAVVSYPDVPQFMGMLMGVGDRDGTPVMPLSIEKIRSLAGLPLPAPQN